MNAIGKPPLSCTGVDKHYDGLVALDGVSFDVRSGEVFGIIGPNGAGKTTLFDVISGVTTATSGTMIFEGRDISRLPASKIAALGLQRTFQTPVAFPDMTIRDNVLVGAYFGGNGTVSRDVRRRDEKIAEVLDRCGLGDASSQLAGQLPVLGRKQLMIATALVSEPTLLMLDEPIGGLNSEERKFMLQLLRGINKSGTTLLIIEHVMSALLSVADTLLILDHGKTIFRGPPDQALKDDAVVQAYLGTEADSFKA